MASSSDPLPPSERASQILNKLPSSPNLITKGGTAILGTGLIATAISQELYVVNEETVLLVGSVILFSYIAKVRALCAALRERGQDAMIEPTTTIAFVDDQDTIQPVGRGSNPAYQGCAR